MLPCFWLHMLSAVGLLSWSDLDLTLCGCLQRALGDIIWSAYILANLAAVTLVAFHCRLEQAVLKTIADGGSECRTPDIGGSGSTDTFTDAIIANL